MAGGVCLRAVQPAEPTLTLAVHGHRYIERLAVTTSERTALSPDLPTIAESALPNYEVTSWFGALAPKDTPAEIVTKWNTAVNGMLQLPEVKQKLQQLALEPRGGTPEEFAQFVKQDLKVWDNLIREEGIQLD